MDGRAEDDHYDVLGVARLATPAEIRRAYRQLALRHHPDRAGAAATARFQRIALAYRVLADPIARSAYDVRLRSGPTAGAATAGSAAPDGWTGPRWSPASGAHPIDDLLERVTAPLETLLARGVAQRRDDGVVELRLDDAEARSGGTAAIGVTVRVACPTCGGCAQRGSIWCTRCEFEGHVAEEVTVCIAIPPFVADGATFTVRVDPMDVTPPLRIRVRC